MKKDYSKYEKNTCMNCGEKIRRKESYGIVSKDPLTKVCFKTKECQKAYGVLRKEFMDNLVGDDKYENKNY